jgi:lysophospholipase L1-like esterase
LRGRLAYARVTRRRSAWLARSPAPPGWRCHSIQDAMKIHSNSTLLTTSDSITDCGRVRPAAEAVSWDLGNGYVAPIHALLGATCPGQNIRIRNTGISGSTVRDLAARWQSNVVDMKPDWLSIMIGVNDVWRQLDAPL